MKELSKEKIFEYSSKELLGVMRFDFYDGGLANNNWRKLDFKSIQKIVFLLVLDNKKDAF